MVLAGCSQPEKAVPLPAAKELVRKSSDAMAAVNTVRFAVEVNGPVSGFQITQAAGSLTADGRVSSTAKVSQAGQIVDYEYIVANGKSYLKGPTGGFREVPAAIYGRIFNPATLLRGDKGLPAALRSMTELKTQAREAVDGVDAYRVRGRLDPATVEGLSLLASGSEQLSTIWISRDSSYLLKARLPFKVPGENRQTVVTVSFSDFNKPVDIQPPG